MLAPKRWIAVSSALCAILLGNLPAQAITVNDDAGHHVTLAAPAQRIVSLAPHATELLFAAGAGAAVIGVSQYSDYPPAARHVSLIGAASALDLEKIITLKPDLVVAWKSGSSAAQIATLRQLNIPVFESEPHNFETIASSLERLARLTGTENIGNAAAASFRIRIAALRATYQHRRVLRVFYQVWHKPLMTVNGAHLVSATLRLCGGQNIFAQLPQLSPSVSREAVLARNPEIIIGSGVDDELADWQRFPQLAAVAQHNLIHLNPDLLVRPGPRIVDGAQQLCERLDQARVAQSAK
ncbi:MAG: cobalamin-binding protein [Herbaspirillum sp.]